MLSYVILSLVVWYNPQGETVLLRQKEGSVDYRFFPEPDLPPLVIPDARVEAIKATLPELPEATIARLSQDFGLSERISRLIVCAPGGAAGNDIRYVLSWDYVEKWG